MNKKNILILLILLLLLGTVFTAFRVVHAQPGTFSLNRSVSGSGGLGGSAGDYTLHSTLGQPLAGPVSDGDTVIHSGFWTWLGEAIEEFIQILPLIFR